MIFPPLPTFSSFSVDIHKRFGLVVLFGFFFRAGTQHFQELGVFNNSNVCVVLKASHPCFNTGCTGTYFSMVLGSGLGLEHQDVLIWQDFVSPSEAGKWQIPLFFFFSHGTLQGHFQVNNFCITSIRTFPALPEVSGL